MIARRIIGPQDQFERTGLQNLRDIRPFTVRLSETLKSSASGFVLAALAAAAYLEPALVDIVVPTALLYASWVLTRRPQLPFRLPASARCPDYADPEPGSRKPRRAAGQHFLGWSIDGRELWINDSDARQHMAIPGTTGAGKTTAILSLLLNALAKGSGFVLVNGKGDRAIFSQVLALARRLGREDDVRLLNLMVAGGDRVSHRFNPFAAGNAEVLKELVASQLGEPREGDQNGIFLNRSVALLASLAPVWVWLRDVRGVALNVDVIRFTTELRWIWNFAMKGVYSLRDPETGQVTDVDAAKQIPEDLVWPLKAYLGELPGYSSDLPLDKQKGGKPAEQHGYAVMYYTAAFTLFAVTLGHIFKAETGDIDMRDIVLNRRILVVNLPALEKDDVSLAGLGKLVAATIRSLMAQMLGASPEGDYAGENKPGMGMSPFFVVLDELASYASSGMDRMLQQGRGLNIGFWLGFQEVPGLLARLGERTASLLGNANLTVAMRQQEAGKTRQWLESTAGQTYVSQATHYQGADDGNYREARQAEVRPVSRVDWNDLTSLLEGEAVVLLGGRRVYATLFHAPIDDTGPKRIGVTVMLSRPDPEVLSERLARVREMTARIASGQLEIAVEMSEQPALQVMVEAFAAAAEAGATASACASAALEAVGACPEAWFDTRPPPPSDGTPASALTPMLQAASLLPNPGETPDAAPRQPVDGALLGRIAAIERLMGASGIAASAAALKVIALRDQHLAIPSPVGPPAMSPEVFRQSIAAVVAGLSAVPRSAQRPV